MKKLFLKPVRRRQHIQHFGPRSGPGLSVMICIQFVWHSDCAPERIFWKSQFGSRRQQKTVWSQISSDMAWVLILIQTIWHSDSVPERLYEKVYFENSQQTTTKQTVWTHFRTDRTSFLIWIETVWHSGSIPESFFEKVNFEKKVSRRQQSKQVEPISGRTFCRSWSGANPFDTLIWYSWKTEHFKKVGFERSQQTTTKAWNMVWLSFLTVIVVSTVMPAKSDSDVVFWLQLLCKH